MVILCDLPVLKEADTILITLFMSHGSMISLPMLSKHVGQRGVRVSQTHNEPVKWTLSPFRQ